MANNRTSFLQKSDIEKLSELFDLLARFDHEDKLASEPKSSSTLGDLDPDSKSGSGSK